MHHMSDISVVGCIIIYILVSAYMALHNNNDAQPLVTVMHVTVISIFKCIHIHVCVHVASPKNLSGCYKTTLLRFSLHTN